MKRFLCHSFAAGIFILSAATALKAETAEERRLREIVTDEQEIFEDAAKKGDSANPNDLQAELQQICTRYDALLKDRPEYAMAYVSYGLLLNKVGMRKESTALMVRANSIDSNLPIVKNQIGNYMAEEGKPLEAVNYFMAAIDLSPKEPLYHFQLGNLLVEARDDFLKDGKWTRETLDKTAFEAFRQSTTLAPADWRYAYRFGLAFYDLEKPDWEAALAFWKGFEKTLAPGTEQQICRLHQAKVLGELKRFPEGLSVLDTVTDASLETQKEKLLPSLSAPNAFLPPPSQSGETPAGAGK